MKYKNISAQKAYYLSRTYRVRGKMMTRNKIIEEILNGYSLREKIALAKSTIIYMEKLRKRYKKIKRYRI
jgi:hypothetical protein